MLREQRASEITSGQLFACTNHPVPTPWLDWPCGDQRVSRVARGREKAPWLCQQMPPRTRPRTPMLAWPCGGHLARCPPTAAEGGTGGVRSDRQPWRSSPLGGGRGLGAGEQDQVPGCSTPGRGTGIEQPGTKEAEKLDWGFSGASWPGGAALHLPPWLAVY